MKFIMKISKRNLIIKYLFFSAIIFTSPIIIKESFDRIKEYYNNSNSIPYELREAALWAKNNTPIESLFITHPLHGIGFRYWSQRSQLPNWKDAGIGSFSVKFASYYLNLMAEYGISVNMNTNSFNSINTNDIISVGKKYRADFAIIPQDTLFLTYTKVFENNKWKIVKIN